MADQKKKPRRSEWRFAIDAFTPDTLPMARLADYLTQLAQILGETQSVHLVQIERGSTVLVHEIEEEAVPSVASRVTAVREGRGPRYASEAFRRINRLLAEDDARAQLHDDRSGSHALIFPGSLGSQPDRVAVKQTGTVSGVLVRVGGVGRKVPVLLISDGEQTAGCHADRPTAKKLGEHLFEPVRLFGDGQWNRATNGTWELNRFNIDRFEALDPAPLSQVLDGLRQVAAAWDDGIHLDLHAIRGPEEP